MSDRLPLFLLQPGADPVRLSPSAPAKEDDLQDLIARYPDLIADSDGALLLIEREHGIADAPEASARFSIDHLFVTRSATPVLVEVKRAVDTRLRREVVGQMLDYAANGVAHWLAGSIAQRFEAACRERGGDPDAEISDFLPPDTSAEEFWARVDANFQAGRIKLLFVADEIPRELARIVEFMNDQMTADVRAVELNYFEGANGTRTLAPRIIGETERSHIRKGGGRAKLEEISEEEWLERHIAPKGSEILCAARDVLQIMRDCGAQTAVTLPQASIISSVVTPTGRTAYPLSLKNTGNVQIGFAGVKSAPALASDKARKAFYDRFVAAVGPLPNPRFDGFPSFPVQRLLDQTKLQAFREVAAEFIDSCRMGAPSTD